MINAASNVTSAAFAELKQQTALRVAEQAERQAEQLKTQADEKRKEARDMAQTARELELESGQAQNRADQARAALPPENLIDQLSSQFESITSSLNQQTANSAEQNQNEDVSNSAPQSLNMLGESTGGTINITV